MSCQDWGWKKELKNVFFSRIILNFIFSFFLWCNPFGGTWFSNEIGHLFVLLTIKIWYVYFQIISWILSEMRSIWSAKMAGSKPRKKEGSCKCEDVPKDMRTDDRDFICCIHDNKFHIKCHTVSVLGIPPKT